MNNYAGPKKPGWNHEKEVESVEEDAKVIEREEKPVRKESKKDLRKVIRFAGIGLAVAAVVIALCFALKGNKSDRLSASLTEMGRDWYENFYYDGFEESKRADILSRFKDIGIKVDIDNLSRYNTEVNAEKIEAFKVGQDNGCDAKETKVVIKPKDPYGKTDYDIEAILSCGKK